jgi:hypothetical protein
LRIECIYLKSFMKFEQPQTGDAPAASRHGLDVERRGNQSRRAGTVGGPGAGSDPPSTLT